MDDKWTTAGATVVIAIFTIVLAVATGVQAQLLRQNMGLAHTLERARINVNPRGLYPYRSGVARLACDVGIQNVGRLAARNVSWIIRWEFSPNADRTDFPISVNSPFDGDVVIAHGVEMPRGVSAILFNEFDAARNAAHLESRDWFLFVWGRVNYHDGFRGDRYVRFCHRYNVSAGKNREIPKDYARYHEHGNSTDES